MSIGCRTLTVRDDVQGVDVPVRLLYPTDAAPTPHSFGPYTFDLADDAPVVGNSLPLVVISHGMTGTPWGYRGLATHLVEQGFAVILVEHPGDSRRDPSLSGTAANLANRPRHITLALDAALGDAQVGAQLRRDRAAVIGHSMGGYTALAIVGGKAMALPNQLPGGVAEPVEVARDRRVDKVALLAPAIPWFMAPGALAEVDVPVFVRVGEKDAETPPFFIERMLRSLGPSAKLDYHIVPGAGHFAFFYPVPTALERLPPGQDPPGFERAAYQPQLYAELTAFLR